MDRTANIKKFFTSYRQRLNDLLDRIDIEILAQIAGIIIKAFKENRAVYICGNGGSAATASHMQADFRFFVRYFTAFRPRVIALTDNVPMITAIGNDTSFEDIFVEQLKGIFTPGDVLICISASGNSENVIRAARYANDHGGTSVALVGFTGGGLLNEAKIALYTPNKKGDYGPIEDLHMIFDHLLVNYLAQDMEFLEISGS